MSINSLALAMIVRNENIMVTSILNEVRPYVDEVILVLDRPTRTVEADFQVISQQFACTVISADGDESARRNIYLKHCKCAWVLVLDADERISPESIIE